MSPPAIESLESRTFLTVSFSAADLVGTYSLSGENIRGFGTVLFDGSGQVTGGSFVDGENVTVRIKSGTYSVATDGAFNASIKINDGTDQIVRVVGALNANKDVVILNDSEGIPGEETVVSAIKPTTALTNSDVAGTWRVAGLGSVVFNSSGGVTGGTLQDPDSGLSITISGGSYRVGSAGAVTGSIRLTASGLGTLDVNFSAVMARGEDVAAVTISSAALGTDVFGSSLMTKQSGSFSAADVVGSWRMAGSDVFGLLNFDGAGRVTGGLLDDLSSSGPVTGTYRVRSDGTFLGTLSLLNGTPGGVAISFTASLNPSKNLAVGVGSAGAETSATFVLVRPDGAFAAVSGGQLTVTGTEATDITGLRVSSGKLIVTQNAVTQKFTASAITSIRIAMGLGDDVLTLGSGVIGSTVDGGVGVDRITGGVGNDIISGGAGNDSILGGAGDDTLYGNDGKDTLDGQSGNDSLRGGAGNDSLVGGVGNDRLFADSGNDRLIGSAGIDRLDGGSGTDAAPDDLEDTQTSIEQLLA